MNPGSAEEDPRSLSSLKCYYFLKAALHKRHRTSNLLERTFGVTQTSDRKKFLTSLASKAEIKLSFAVLLATAKS